MAYSATIPYTGGLVGYVKPVSPGSLPSNTPNWGADAIFENPTKLNGIGFTVQGLADGQVYWAYAQAGASPASTDQRLGTVTQSDELIATAATEATAAAAQSTTAATEIGKVPRLSTAIAAGAAARRNKVAATSDTLDETLGAVP